MEYSAGNDPGILKTATQGEENILRVEKIGALKTAAEKLQRPFIKGFFIFSRI